MFSNPLCRWTDLQQEQYPFMDLALGIMGQQGLPCTTCQVVYLAINWIGHCNLEWVVGSREGEYNGGGGS